MARILRGLVIRDVSSVDRAANPGARVLLAKREDLTMAKYGKGKCPHCGGSLDDTDDDVGKHERITKAVSRSHESIARDLMKDDPSLSFQKAMTKALDTAAFSELHRAEKAARFGPGY
jgi:hypothetical protein